MSLYTSVPVVPETTPLTYSCDWSDLQIYSHIIVHTIVSYKQLTMVPEISSLLCMFMVAVS